MRITQVPIGAYLKSGHRRLPLHIVVATAIVFGCLALVGIDAWSMWRARSVALAEDKVETANLARSLAQHAHDMILSVDSVLLGLRERMRNDPNDAVLFGRLHRLMVERVDTLPALHGLFIYNVSGTEIVSSVPPPHQPVQVGDRGYFHHHQADPSTQPYVGAPVRSKSDGSWVITVSRRLNKPDGSFDGVVLASITTDYLNRFYESFDVGENGFVSLVQADGTLIARSPFSAAAVGASVAGGEIWQKYLPLSPVGSFRFTSARLGTQEIGSYRRVDDYPLVVVVAHGFDELLAEWRADALRHLGISIGIAGALAVVGLRLARQIRSRQTAERQYRLLADNSSDAIICIGVDGRRLYISPSFESLTGWSAEEGIGRDFNYFVHPTDRPLLKEMCNRLFAGERSMSLTYRYIRPDGTYVWVEARFHQASSEDGGEAMVVGNIRDVTERKAAEDQVAAAHIELQARADTDGLTGLANRRRFDEVLAQEWRRMRREQMPLSLILIDIDHFKRYNDTYGHPAGDQCLRLVCETIGQFSRRPGDIAARYGGEEMAVLMSGTHADGAIEVANRIRQAIEALAISHIGNPPLKIVTASFGIATMIPQPDDKKGCDALVAHALVAQSDAALYEAKRRGRNCTVDFADVRSSQFVEAWGT